MKYSVPLRHCDTKTVLWYRPRHSEKCSLYYSFVTFFRRYKWISSVRAPELRPFFYWFKSSGRLQPAGGLSKHCRYFLPCLLMRSLISYWKTPGYHMKLTSDWVRLLRSRGQVYPRVVLVYDCKNSDLWPMLSAPESGLSVLWFFHGHKHFQWAS